MTDKEAVYGFFILFFILGLCVLQTYSCYEDLHNNPSRRVQRCRVEANRNPLIQCQQYSIYAEGSSCSCNLRGTDNRITFPRNWEWPEE